MTSDSQILPAAPSLFADLPVQPAYDVGAVQQPGETRLRFLRVVTLEDGETVLNAFFDRNFREGPP